MDAIIKGLRTNRTFAITSLLVVALILIAVAAPLLAPYDPTFAEMRDAYMEPSSEHFFGTDKLGRDCFSRVIYGGRASLAGVLILVASVFTVGTTLGVISGYFGGKVDMVIMRISDLMISFPGMILAIAVAGIMGGSLVNAVIALTIVSWTKYARLARSLVLKIKSRDFVEAAIVNGGTARHILWTHILPNILPLMVVTAAADIGALMMELAGLSFLGLGVKPPMAEWGSMMSSGRSMIQTYPWVVLSPGIAIFVSVAIFNLLGDTVRDYLDPKSS